MPANTMIAVPASALTTPTLSSFKYRRFGHLTMDDTEGKPEQAGGLLRKRIAMPSDGSVACHSGAIEALLDDQKESEMARSMAWSLSVKVLGGGFKSAAALPLLALVSPWQLAQCSA